MLAVIIQVIVNSTIQVAVPMTQLVENWIDDTSVEENNFGKRWTMRLKEKDERSKREVVDARLYSIHNFISIDQNKNPM